MKPFTVFVSHASELPTDHRPHGDGLLAWEFVRQLAKRGHRVHVAAETIDIADRVPPNVRILRYSLKARASVLRRLEQAVAIRTCLEQLLRHETVDVMHQLNPVEPALSGLLPFLRIPLILGPLMPDWPETEQTRARPRSPLAAPLWATVDLLDALMRQHARTHLLSTEAAAPKLPERLRVLTHTVLPFPVDTERFKPRGGSARFPEILFVSNLEARKGLSVLLRAFARVRRDNLDARLTIGGDGPARQGAEALVSELQLSGSVDFLGALDREGVARAMDRCTVFCQPSFGEPFGATVLEAMSCGKPVVVTDQGGPAQLVDPSGGVRVACGSVEGIAAALIRLLRDEEVRRSMGDFNRRRVLAEFSFDAVLSKLEAVYAVAAGARA